MTENTYKKLLDSVYATAAPNVLESRILGRVERSIAVNAKVRMYSYITTGCVAVVGCVLVINTMIASMASSGFTSYVSILASDGGVLLGSWREFGMALIESFPIVSGVVVIALVLAAIYSASRSVFYVKTLSRGPATA